MLNIRNLARQIIDREGGFVNDPDDPGGATKFGITLQALQRFGSPRSPNDKAVATIDDLHQIEQADAEEMLVKHYFEAPQLSQLPMELQPSAFDMYVNSGRNAVRILQTMLVRIGFQLNVDGIIGPQTAAAAGKAMQRAPMHLTDAYAIARRNYYLQLADARPPLRKFARRPNGSKGGWITRAEAFMAVQFHLSDHEFRMRTRAWD